jgi:hypothetical protein
VEGVAVTVGLVSDGSLRELLALLPWDTVDPVTSLRVTTTKSLVTEPSAVFVSVILLSALSVGGAVLSQDTLRICRISPLSLQFVLV